MIRLVLVIALLATETRADDHATATVRVTATIASWATVEVDGDCAHVESNEREVLAWANDVPLHPDDPWICFGPDERLAANEAGP